MVRHLGITFLLLIILSFGMVNQSGAKVSNPPVDATTSAGTRLVVFEAFMRPT
jgi:hypothetical protein